jgi:trk system potassium uptake protein TrkA
MRIVFSGAESATIMAAKLLIEKGYELIIIDVDKNKIDELSENMDCSFLHGDSQKPAILKEVDPKNCDFLFCLTDSDEANIITSLLGRSMGFKRVVTSIGNPDLENMCREIGLEDIVIPARSISRNIVDMVRGMDNIEWSTILKGEARFFSFVVSSKDSVNFKDMQLPEEAKIIYYYRDDKFFLVDKNTTFKIGDEVIILTNADNLPKLKERWDKSLVVGVSR